MWEPQPLTTRRPPRPVEGKTLPLPNFTISAGPGFSLYRLGADPTENSVSIVIAQKYFDCCFLIRCRGNLFTKLLPSNERLLCLHYSGFQASCHIIITIMCLRAEMCRPTTETTLVSNIHQCHFQPENFAHTRPSIWEFLIHSLSSEISR
jgi:hypothetical protein